MSDNWTIVGTDASVKGLDAAGSVFTVSNGYLALRGSVPLNRTGKYPGTIIAGVFSEADMSSSIPPNGAECRYLDASLFDEPKYRPSVANLPDPMCLCVLVDGCELRFEDGEVSGFRQSLDLRTGEYTCEYELAVEQGTLAIRMSRFTCMERPHLAAMRCELTALDFNGMLSLRAGIDTTVRSNLHGEKQFDVVESAPDGVKVRLAGSGVEVKVRTATLEAGGRPRDSVVEAGGFHGVEWTLTSGDGSRLALEHFVSLSSSEDDAPLEEEVRPEGMRYEVALAANRAWWDEAWEQADVEIDGDETAQRYLRFCLFHLISAAPRHTDRLSVPCKLLSGEWYQGSVFYDTDLYILPFYTFVMPKVARGCLNFRYLGLENGRAIARKYGYAGAKFAWQSGPHGEEVLGPWYRFVHTNIHINADVVYALNLFKNATADAAFMRGMGIDILIESARFYASRAVRDGEVYHLKDVSGPDEGHCESTDNFYTNAMAAWTLRWAANIVGQLASESLEQFNSARERLHIGEGEPDAWRRVANGLRFLYDPETKIYEQYDGFHALKPIPPNFRDEQNEWWFTVFPYQAIHQPDVVMAMTLLREDYPDDDYEANRTFYGERSMDFSSMSHVIHSLAAKDAGDMDEAYRQFIITAGEDLDETLTGRGDTADGLHGTATGGAWMAAVFGFGGIRLTDAGLTVNPRLPEHWKALRFNIRLRGERLRFEVTQSTLTITVGSETSLDMPATVCCKEVVLQSGKTYQFASS